MGDQLAIVLKNTYTTSAVQQRIALLKEFLEFSFYGAGGGQPSVELLNVFVTEHGVDPQHAEALRQWGPSLWGTITTGTLYQALNALLAQVKTVPVLTLYTPVKFGPPDMAKLGEHIRNLTGKTLIIDDHVDTDLIVGCAFVLNGVYHEYSFPFFVGRKKEEFMTLITRYGRN